jgi:ubiquinone biosynthesis protein COQ9
MRQLILDTALQLGNQHGWEQLSLHHIATKLEISLADISQHYAQKDDLADAWFDRADKAMLSLNLASDAAAADKLELALRSWLQALAPYHNLTGQMLLYKLEPGHLHLQGAALLRISRTVQWLREMARLNARGLPRIGQELALSSLFVSVFIYWLNDRSAAQQCSLAWLKRKLQLTDALGLWR